METISVVVPVYHVEAYLPQCLDSLAAQTYDAMQFVLVDDGSRDASGAICDAYAARDARFMVIHQENKGVSCARNAGLRAATGAWIGFMDGDDWAEPDMYFELARKTSASNTDVVMCGYYEYLPDPQRAPLIRGPAARDADSVHDALFRCMTRNGYFTSVWNKLFRRELIYENGVPVDFDSALGVGEDEVWLLTALTRCRNAAFVPRPLYHWRSRTDSATRAPEITPRRLSILDAKRQAIEIAAQYGPDLVKLGKSRMLNDCYHLKVMAYDASDWVVYKEVCQKVKPLWKDWLFSNDLPLLRKAKVLSLELLQRCHASKETVLRVYNARRKQAAKPGGAEPDTKEKGGGKNEKSGDCHRI